MGPKVAVSADEDVKFLLTIIKQLEGTVSTLTLLVQRTIHHARVQLTAHRFGDSA